MNSINSFNLSSQHIYEQYKQKFNSEIKAKRYSTRHVDSKKSKREKQCIKNALADVKANSLILDLPCGTGRLSFFIQQLGFKVLGADCSEHMLSQAKQLNQRADVNFELQDVAAIKHENNKFAATVCNRLFHHYPTSEIRRMALKELARVTEGPIVVSFFNSNSLSALWSRLRNFLRNKKPTDRLAIPFATFKEDIEACGLKIQATYHTLYGLSPQTYVKLVKV